MNTERVQLLLSDRLVDMVPGPEGWQFEDVNLTVSREGCVSIQALRTPVCKVRLCFEAQPVANALVLGDAWERAYADLEWKAPDPDRKLPWYFFAWDKTSTHCWGVKTGPNALCYWLYDGNHASVTLDIRSGTNPLPLNGQKLELCTIVTACIPEDPHTACTAFCSMLCDNPRVPDRPIFGGNDWYCNYGNNSFEKIRVHAQRIALCAQGCSHTPYMVIDDGWQLCHTARGTDFNGGPWGYANANFGDMKKMADTIVEAGCIPGIWFRPLETMEKLPRHWYLKRDFPNVTLDPSVPEVLDLIRRDVRQIVKWGYRLIKHDFSSADIFGKWGFEMDSELYYGQVSFADGTRTTAQIMKDFYLAIREAAGEDVLIMGCNTFSHLSAGIMDLQRTGDDTSGLEWDRTRRYGINTLAFRMMQHKTFYAVDADCVGITNDISWELNRQWLDVLARSGTPLFVSIAQDAFSDQVREDICAAFRLADSTETVSAAMDWMETRTPQVWKSSHGTQHYSW